MLAIVPRWEWRRSHRERAEPSAGLLIGRPNHRRTATSDTNVSVIGCDGANGTYVQLYSDERGVGRVYEMSIGNGGWKLWREGAPFSQRFTGTFSDDENTITGRWEIPDDGTNYTTDFDPVFHRVTTG